MISFDTIVARATPAGKGAIAVVRVSGPTAFACTDALLKNKISLKNSHTALLRQFFDANGMIDEALLRRFDLNVQFKLPTENQIHELINLTLKNGKFRCFCRLLLRW